MGIFQQLRLAWFLVITAHQDVTLFTDRTR